MDEQNQFEPTLIQKAYATTCDLVSETAEYLASFSFGQSVLRQTDRAMWTVEKCAEWSVPTQSPQKHHHQNGTFGKPGPLVRPLPWIFFLPMLVFLRILRLSLSIAALLMGFETVKPSSMVRFIQVRRRRIRALKFLGLRKIRHRKSAKEIASKNHMTFRERFYNIMSRAMCFRVTNSDMDEEITVKKDEEEPQTSTNSNSTCARNTTRQRSVTGRDLKRKYIEILKNNYYDWEDVEDDEELIDRITQLAEDEIEDEDPDFLPAEDSATEDSMSEAEEDTVSASPVTSPTTQSPPKVQRLSSHNSLTNETIEEEEEDSESTTVSANSDDESTQQLEKKDSPKSSTQSDVSTDKKDSIEPGTTSDEFFSPMNSISASPEPKFDSEISKCNNDIKTNEISTKIDEKNDSISSEIQVTVKNSQNSTPVTEAKANSNGFTPRAKKHKHKRRFSNLLRKKRK